jgi:nitrite reductase/ring-hydroxylating ferredoxin subunit
MNWVKAAKIGDVPTNTGLAVEVEGQAIALYKVDGQVYAIDGVCPHAGGPMAEGSLNGCLAMCPWHGWRFSVVDGTWVDAPRSKLCVECYKVEQQGEDILIDADWLPEE